jgi:hypothetical protein
MRLLVAVMKKYSEGYHRHSQSVRKFRGDNRSAQNAMATLTNPPIIEDLDRLLWGAAEIAPVINRTVPQTFRMLEQGLLPAKKVRRLWVSTRRHLQSALTPNIPA